MNQVFAFLPSIRVFQVFGLCPFSIDDKYEPQVSRKIKSYIRFWIGLTSIGLFNLYWESNFYLNGAKQDVGTTVDFIQLIGMRASHFIILFEVLLNEKSLINFFSTLSVVDAKMSKLGIKQNFNGERRRYLIELVAAFTFYFGTALLHLTVLVLRSQFDLIFRYWFHYIIPYLFSCFRYFQAFNCIWFIKKRIDLLNEKLELIEMKEQEIKTITLPTNYKLLMTDNKFQRRPKPIKNFEQFILFREGYDKLYVLSTIVNYSLGLSLLVNIANDFITLTANLYFVFLRLRTFSPNLDDILRILESVFWCFPHLLNIVIIAGVCHFTVQTSIKTALIVHKIENDIDNEQQNLFLEHFSLQLLHQKIQFSAFGFFNLDYTLLYTITAAATTYLVILIQFYISELSNANQTT